MKKKSFVVLRKQFNKVVHDLVFYGWLSVIHCILYCKKKHTDLYKKGSYFEESAFFEGGCGNSSVPSQDMHLPDIEQIFCLCKEKSWSR